MLSLLGGRFDVEVAWSDALGGSGVGTGVKLSDDTGYFWFTDETLVEIPIKVLDGTNINGNFWVFLTGLTDDAFTVTVTDTQTSAVKEYTNALGELTSVSDIAAFPMETKVSAEATDVVPHGADVTKSLFNSKGPAACVADATTLCLSDSRFTVQVAWEDFGGNTGAGQAMPLTTASGAFWLFSANNLDVWVKVEETLGENNGFTIAAGALTNVQLNLTITDQDAGVTAEYFSPLGSTMLFIDRVTFGEGCGTGTVHSADTNSDHTLDFAELLRVIQLYNARSLHCAATPEATEDGYEPGEDVAAQSCCPHTGDFVEDWSLDLAELLRMIQLFSLGGYTSCPGVSEDGFCATP